MFYVSKMFYLQINKSKFENVRGQLISSFTNIGSKDFISKENTTQGILFKHTTGNFESNMLSEWTKQYFKVEETIEIVRIL